VRIQIQRTAEMLDQHDGAGLCCGLYIARFLDQVDGNEAVDDTRHLACGHRNAGEQEAQRVQQAISLFITCTLLFY